MQYIQKISTFWSASTGNKLIIGVVGVIALLLPCALCLLVFALTPVDSPAAPTVALPTITPIPQQIMYFCGIDRCRDSGEYGKMIFQTGINVWNNPEPNRNGVHHRASHGDKVIVIDEKRVDNGPGGLWYQLDGGGWTNDLWLTDAVCTVDNLPDYSFTDCLAGKY